MKKEKRHKNESCCKKKPLKSSTSASHSAEWGAFSIIVQDQVRLTHAALLRIIPLFSIFLNAIANFGKLW